MFQRGFGTKTDFVSDSARNLGLQASAGKQRVLISWPQPNRLLPGQNFMCKSQLKPALIWRLRDLPNFERIVTLGSYALYQPPAEFRPNASPGHWLSVLWNSVLRASPGCQSPNSHVNLLSGVRCPVDLGTGIWGPPYGLSNSS